MSYSTTKTNNAKSGRKEAVQSLPDPTRGPLCILIAEDDQDLRRFSSTALTRRGYQVDAVQDGALAWHALLLHDYDLLITDNNMPKITGVELLEKIREARMTLPVIMATGVLPAEFTRSPWLRPSATLIKPFAVEELVDTVKKVLCGAPIPAPDPQLSIDFELTNYRTPRAAEPEGLPAQGPSNSPHRILVVDEDADLRSLYAEALTRPGYQVDVVEDGAAGWDALLTNNYHLLITENDMPKLSGVELVGKLRAARMALPVVMAAGRLPTHELARNPTLQLAAILEKPFAVEVLLNMVQNILYATGNPSTQSPPSPKSPDDEPRVF